MHLLKGRKNAIIVRYTSKLQATTSHGPPMYIISEITLGNTTFDIGLSTQFVVIQHNKIEYNVSYMPISQDINFCKERVTML